SHHVCFLSSQQKISSGGREYAFTHLLLPFLILVRSRRGCAPSMAHRRLPCDGL
uniref:Uncharacterized protein n=1 Tax=Loxodonta africana TaxID=9785 RepID=G3UEG4_LOXAF